MSAVEFELPGLPSLGNAAYRTHWRTKRSESAKWHGLVALVVGPQRPPKPWKQVRMVLTRCSSGEPDYDGLVISFKAIVDGLVRSRVLEDDKRSNIVACDYRWEKVGPKMGKVKIRVEPVLAESSITNDVCPSCKSGDRDNPTPQRRKEIDL